MEWAEWECDNETKLVQFNPAISEFIFVLFVCSKDVSRIYLIYTLPDKNEINNW